MEASDIARRARFVRDQFPEGGLFRDQAWRVSPRSFPLGDKVAEELQSLGRVLLRFNRAVNLLYRQSAAGKQPPWVAEWLDRGKPSELIALQRDPAFHRELPRVIRPDILLTADGFAITELDAVPGGIGLTDWLNHTYAKIETPGPIGGADGMTHGFASIFGETPRVHVVVSEEAATYRPEMRWLADRLGADRFQVRDTAFADFRPGDAVYRFFELFDVGNVANAEALFEAARKGEVRLTPPPRPIFEEKMLFALLWNRNLDGFWHRELGEGFYRRLRRCVPYSWLVDPAPLPPQGAIPELNLTDWHQLKNLSKRERELILKASGFSETAWGARSVSLGSDLSVADWSAAVDRALRQSERLPHVLQRYRKPRLVEASWYDFEAGREVPMKGRVRLCPYYFVSGEGDEARANLGGVLATICPADKKIIHGMQDAILAPCTV